MMKKTMLFFAVFCILLAGCSNAAFKPEEPQPPAQSVQPAPDKSGAAAVPGVTVQPLPDTTMDDLNDAILSVSLEEGDAYVDDTGKMQMDLKIYTYDRYDMEDIARLKVGDVLAAHGGEVKVTSMERSDSGAIVINGGVQAGGFDLVTDDTCLFYATGLNDAKDWYEVGEKTIRVSVDFVGKDSAEPGKEEKTIYPGDFLNGDVTNYDFTPYNTTIRVENGQIVELTRVYVP